MTLRSAGFVTEPITGPRSPAAAAPQRMGNAPQRFRARGARSAGCGWSGWAWSSGARSAGTEKAPRSQRRESFFLQDFQDCAPKLEERQRRGSRRVSERAAVDDVLDRDPLRRPRARTPAQRRRDLASLRRAARCDQARGGGADARRSRQHGAPQRRRAALVALRPDRVPAVLLRPRLPSRARGRRAALCAGAASHWHRDAARLRSGVPGRVRQRSVHSGGGGGPGGGAAEAGRLARASGAGGGNGGRVRLAGARPDRRGFRPGRHAAPCRAGARANWRALARRLGRRTALLPERLG